MNIFNISSFANRAWRASADIVVIALIMSMFPAGLAGLDFVFADSDGATITSFTVDGGTSTFVGPSVPITLNLTVVTSGSGPTNDWKSTGWRIDTSPGTLTCVDHSNHTSSQTYRETFSVPAPSSSGTYNVYLTAYQGDGCTSPSGSATHASAVMVSSKTLIFSDDFGTSDSNTFTNWSDPGGANDTGITGNGTGDDVDESRDSTSSNKFAKIGNEDDAGDSDSGDDEWICRTMDATDYENLFLTYFWKEDIDGDGSSDQGIVEYKSSGSCSDSTGWTTIDSHQIDGDDWSSQESHSSFSSVENSTFLLRFRNDSNRDNEYFRVDDVFLWGDEVQNGTLIINKTLINNNGGNNATTSFSFRVNGGDQTAFEEDGSNVVTVPVGDYSVVEVGAPLADYITSYTDCSGTIANGETKTCTIENDDRTATLHIIKNVVGGDGTFNFVVTQDETLFASPNIDTAEDGNDSVDVTINANTDYIVEEPSVPEGWDFTSVSCDAGVAGPSATSYTVNVDSGVIVNCTYTNTKRASFSLAKLSAPEDSESQFKFDLTGPSDFTDSETFSPSGTWSEHAFDLVPGDYSIIETIVSGDWTGTQEMACNGDGDNDPSGSVASTLPFTLNAGEEMSCTVNNTEDALISGMKFEDVDADGIAGNDPGLEEWTITATKVVADDPETSEVDESADPPTYETVTGEGGDYSFRLPPGEYTVCESQQEDWYQSYPISDSTGVIECEDGYGYDITVEAGTNISGQDFGNYQNGSILGTKWNDENGDGEWQSNCESECTAETGLEGWTIAATPIDGEGGDAIGDSLTTTTAGDGSYSFDFLPAQFGWWRITEVAQSGWEQTAPQGGTYEVNVSGGTTYEANDFGNHQNAAISGLKWNDEDGDSTRDEGDSGLSGWVMTATPVGADGNPLSEDSRSATSTTTGESGSYSLSFDLSDDGFWKITETTQGGWTKTFPAEGSSYLVEITATSTTIAGKDFGNHSEQTSNDGGQQEEEIVRPSGGNGPIVGSLAQGQVLGVSIGPSGQVLGTSTTATTTNETICSEPEITQYMRRGKKNNPEQVKLLQQFLNNEMGSNLPLTGFFGVLTEAAVKAFQQKYASDILTPWGLTNPTGYVYKFTLWKINSIRCTTLNAPKPEV